MAAVRAKYQVSNFWPRMDNALCNFHGPTGVLLKLGQNYSTCGAATQILIFGSPRMANLLPTHA